MVINYQSINNHLSIARSYSSLVTIVKVCFHKFLCMFFGFCHSPIHRHVSTSAGVCRCVSGSVYENRQEKNLFSSARSWHRISVSGAADNLQSDVALIIAKPPPSHTRENLSFHATGARTIHSLKPGLHSPVSITTKLHGYRIATSTPHDHTIMKSSIEMSLEFYDRHMLKPLTNQLSAISYHIFLSRLQLYIKIWLIKPPCNSLELCCTTLSDHEPWRSCRIESFWNSTSQVACHRSQVTSHMSHVTGH